MQKKKKETVQSKRRKIDNPLFEVTVEKKIEKNLATGTEEKVISNKYVGVAKRPVKKSRPAKQGEKKSSNQSRKTKQPPEVEREVVPYAEERALAGINGYVDVIQKSTNIISIVDDLVQELDTTREIKDALEEDLAVTRNSLTDVSAAYTELQVKSGFLEEQAELASVLREDIAFSEEERSKTARLLAETESNLEETTTRYNEILIELEKTEDELGKVIQEKSNIEGKIGVLGEKLQELEKLPAELQHLDKMRDQLEDQLDKLNCENDSTKLELTLKRDEAGQLRDKLLLTSEKFEELREQFEVQRLEIRSLREENRHHVHNLKMLAAKYEGTCKELAAAKNALQSIHDAATHTGIRRQKESKQLSTGKNKKL